MQSTPTRHEPSPFGLTLRRFSGHASYVDTLSPLRVAHLTDLHVGRVTPLQVQLAAVELANAQNPDLVVITGDFVCHSQLYLHDLTEVIRAVKAPVMCVLGNHDHWCGAQEVRNALKRGGAEVLDNAWTSVQLGHQRLQIVGLDDAYTSNHDVARATRGLNPHQPSLGLSHIGEEADRLWAHGVPMVLSGHTHAGHITVARLHELALGRIVGHRYVHGMYGTRRLMGPAPGAVYVGAGVGAAVMPLRVGERGQREVTVFELGHQPGQPHEHHDDQPAHPGRAPSEKTIRKRAAAVLLKAQRREHRAKHGREI